MFGSLVTITVIIVIYHIGTQYPTPELCVNNFLGKECLTTLVKLLILAKIPGKHFNIESKIRKEIICNAYECIEDLVNIPDADMPDLSYQIDTKILETFSKGHHYFIRIFSAYIHYQTQDDDPIGDGWTKFTNINFNEYHITDYDDFRRLYITQLVNIRLTSTTFFPNHNLQLIT